MVLVAMVVPTIFDMLIAPGGRTGNFYNSASVVGGHGGGTNTDAQLTDTTLYPSITIANGFTPGGAGGSYWTGSAYSATDGRMAGLLIEISLLPTFSPSMVAVPVRVIPVVVVIHYR